MAKAANETTKKTLEEIEALFQNPNTQIERVFDSQIAYQQAEGTPLEQGPCHDIQVQIDRWTKDPTGEWILDWEAARKRAQGARPHVVADEEGETETSEEDSDQKTNKVTKIGDADLLGEDHPEMQELLDRNFVFMTGNIYGQNDRRNTQDGDWKRMEMSLLAWLVGVDKGKNSWGLARHPEAKRKEGASIVFAETIGGSRKDAAAKEMQSIGLDIDSGAKAEKVKAKLVKQGIFSILYTSFNHKKTELILKHDDIVRKMKLDDTPNRAHVQQYLREHHKDRFDESFINSIEVINFRKQTKDGLRVVLKTDPLDKFRIIIPLWEPVTLSDLAPTVAAWKDVWADLVCGVAVNMLDISFDATSCDVNRGFYTPRHPAGGEWDCAVIQGRPLRIGDIEPYSKATYVKNRGEPEDPFMEGTSGDGADDRETYHSPGGLNLNRWHTKHKERFNIADVLETYCHDKLRKAGGEKVGTVHIECPFEHEHTSEGGTATMAMNPDANSEYGYWTIFCKHDACQGRNKLEFLQRMLEDGWFEESLLKDDAWNLGAADDDEPEQTSQSSDDIASAVSDLDDDSSDDSIRAVVRPFAKKNADAATFGRLKNAIADRVPLTKPEVGKLIKEERANARATARKKNKDGPLRTDSGFETLVDMTKKKLAKENEKDPFLFGYIEQPIDLRERADGGVRVKTLTYDGLSEVISRTVKYEKPVGDGNYISAPPPDEVVKNIHHQDLTEYTRALRGIAEAPFFDKDANLVSETGYHSESQVYLSMPPGFEVARVSANPSDEELARCRELFLEVLGDFPFDGMTPEEIADGKSPSFANAVGMMALPFMREMIDEPTPGHLVNKPAPGTGAGLLLDVTAIVWTGKVATMMTIPKRKEEIGKTIIAKLRSGASYLCFDNIPDNLDSDDLAMALAQGSIDARVLGKNDASAVDDVEVSATWIFTGNNVTMSGELLRRMVMISLNAGMASPEKRGGWRHGNLKQWTKEHRSELVWACLTIIQKWIAGGRQPLVSDARKGSFDEWLACVGGVLRDAGIENFYGNEDELKEAASDAEDDGLSQLASVLADYLPGQEFYISGDGNAIIDILNNGPDGRAILIPKWGHLDGMYSNVQRLGTSFKKFAGKPQIARRTTNAGYVTVEIGFTQGYNANRKCNFYRLKMRLPSAKEWIEVVPADKGSPEWAAWQAICG